MLAPILLFVIARRCACAADHLAQFFLLGILGLAASNYFYYLAIQKTTVATAIVLQYVAPVWVLLYMLARRLAASDHVAHQRRVLRRCSVALWRWARVCREQQLSLACDVQELRINSVGVIAAELAAVSFAFYNVYGQHLVQIYDRWTVLVYSLLGAAVFWLIVNPPWKIAAQHYSGAQWLFMLVFSITSMLIPFSLYFAGLQYLDRHARHRDRVSGAGVGDPADGDDTG